MIKIQDEFLSQESTIEELYNFFHYADGWQFDFLKKEYILGNCNKSDLENLISKIIKELCSLDIGFTAKVGYEVWVNVLDIKNNDLDHHVDCDEFSEKFDTAKRTAVIHLGRDEELIGGELAIDTSDFTPTYKFEKTTAGIEKRMDNNWIKIPFKTNRLIIFDSNYPHAVLPIKNITKGASRISLMISSWDKEINIKR